MIVSDDIRALLSVRGLHRSRAHYYERKLGRDHIPMACLRCGKIIEFVSDGFERLKQQVERDCRFHVLISRLEIGGYCAACRGGQTSAAQAAS